MQLGRHSALHPQPSSVGFSLVTGALSCFLGPARLVGGQYCRVLADDWPLTGHRDRQFRV